jgi:hypothetical protein
MPAIDVGMTEGCRRAKNPSNIGVGIEGCTSFAGSVGERKIMNHFVVTFSSYRTFQAASDSLFLTKQLIHTLRLRSSASSQASTSSRRSK